MSAARWSTCRPATCATTCFRASWPSRRRTASIQAAERRREEAERAVREAEDRARDNAATLGRTVLTIPQQAGDDGRLFGSVTTQDIADAIRDARGIKIDRRKVHLEEPIRHTGHVHGRRRGHRRGDGDGQDDGGAGLAALGSARPAQVAGRVAACAGRRVRPQRSRI